MDCKTFWKMSYKLLKRKVSSKKKERRKDNGENKISALGWLAIGIIILLSVIIYKIDATTTQHHLSFYEEIVLDFFRDCSFALIVFCIVSYFLETQHMTKVLINRIVDVISGNEHIKNLSPKRLEEINEIAENKLYFNDKNRSYDCLYNIFKKELIAFSKTLYFDNYYLHVDASVFTSNGKEYMKELTTKRIKIVNPTEHPIPFDLPIGTEYFCLENNDNENRVETKEYKEIIKNVSLRGEQQKKYTNRTILGKFIDETLSGGYGIDTKLPPEDQKILIPSGECLLEIVVESISLGFDREYIAILSNPCRTYNVSYSFDSELHCVIGHGFLCSAQSDLQYFKQSSKHSISISSYSWALPGSGSYFCIEDIKPDPTPAAPCIPFKEKN